MPALQRLAFRAAYRALGGTSAEHAVDGARLHTLTFGADEDHTVLLLHGLGSSSTTWFRVLPALRPLGRLVAIDLPPHGLSSLDGATHLMPEDMARLLLPLIEREARGEVTLVGSSMGAWVAQWLLHLAPERFDRVVLIAPAGARIEESLEVRALMRPTSADDVLALWERMWFRRPVLAPVVAGSAVKHFHRAEIASFLDQAKEEHTLGDEELAAIETPALVVWGNEDRLLPPDTPRYLAERWGGPLERTYLARCGHMPQWERPEAVVRAVRGPPG